MDNIVVNHLYKTTHLKIANNYYLLKYAATNDPNDLRIKVSHQGTSLVVLTLFPMGLGFILSMVVAFYNLKIA